MRAEERAYLYWLHAAPGVGRCTALRLLEVFGSAEEIYRRAGSAAKFLAEGARRERFLAFRDSRDPLTEWEAAEHRGIHFTALCLEDYPERLRHIPDPPFGLTWMGRLPDPGKPAVSIIGARQCSPYGRQMATRFGADLGAAGVAVVSGMAVGIDGLAQEAALRAGGESFALLGSGVDVCYPQENRGLYDQLLWSGGLISESPPGAPPARRLFPLRNRLISAFCDILLVIEARVRSGTLITVDAALEQGRDIFAVPGRVTDGLSDGCNQLIRQGAGIALTASDLLDALYSGGGRGARTRPVGARATVDSIGLPGPQSGPCPQISPDRFTPEERLVLGALDILPRSMSEVADALAASTPALTVPEVLGHLVDLCLKGAAVQEGSSFRLRGTGEQA